MNDEFEKFMEIIGGKGVMKLFVEVYLEDYLFMLRSFEIKNMIIWNLNFLLE